ncbi:hypothetical protein MGSAQ_000554, partial [marine sediment metagenome]
RLDFFQASQCLCFDIVFCITDLTTQIDRLVMDYGFAHALIAM